MQKEIALLPKLLNQACGIIIKFVSDKAKISGEFETNKIYSPENLCRTKLERKCQKKVAQKRVKNES